MDTFFVAEFIRKSHMETSLKIVFRLIDKSLMLLMLHQKITTGNSYKFAVINFVREINLNLNRC